MDFLLFEVMDVAERHVRTLAGRNDKEWIPHQHIRRTGRRQTFFPKSLPARRPPDFDEK
jgi:hypothetical protein